MSPRENSGVDRLPLVAALKTTLILQGWKKSLDY
jgi:hypothetical protein